ncbi:MAG TPA: dTMP kinase [Peptococcaceae bacterium]|nr:dTMP kinase [Peptococcaceae bacterium]
MANKGKFIVLEGLDGCGSTTQLHKLKEWFDGKGSSYGQAWATWEPTDGPVGNVIRLALKKRLQRFDEMTMALLFAADRTDHIYRNGEGGQETGILDKLNQGIHVISDRYVLSSLAYQARALGLDWVSTANAFALTPDVTIYLDLPAEVAADRMAKGRSHQDMYEELHEQQQIRLQYEAAMDYLMKKGHKFLRVKGDSSPAEVHEAIVQAITPLLKDNG